MTVVGGSLAGRRSVAFIRALGAAYRASGRERPPFDAFSIHPYPPNSSVGPGTRAGAGSIGIADYDRLVSLLEDAFGEAPDIVYGEYGIQTQVPHRKRDAYAGYEQLSTKAVAEATQARFYEQAIRLASCQPKVRMLLFFHVFDEWQRLALQTGVYYADRTPKASRDAVRRALDRGVECGR